MVRGDQRFPFPEHRLNVKVVAELAIESCDNSFGEQPFGTNVGRGRDKNADRREPERRSRQCRFGLLVFREDFDQELIAVLHGDVEGGLAVRRARVEIRAGSFQANDDFFVTADGRAVERANTLRVL